MRFLRTIALLLILPSAAVAGFVDMEEGARATGMGGAFIGVADDATGIFWNPAGLVLGEEGLRFTGMRSRVFSVSGLSEDCIGLGYSGWRRASFGFGWARSGVEDIYHEDTIVFGVGRKLLLGGLSLGSALRVYRVGAPGYAYYNDPNFDDDGTDYAVDLGMLYKKRKWSLGLTYRNIGEPDISLISTTEEGDPVYSELRFGATYIFRDAMLISGEIRRPRRVPGYIDSKLSYYLGTEIWFFDTFALRTGLHRDHATAGLGLRVDKVSVDAALVSGRRPGNKYRLSLTLDGLFKPGQPEVEPPKPPPPPLDSCAELIQKHEGVVETLGVLESQVEAERSRIAGLRDEIEDLDRQLEPLEAEVTRLEAKVAEFESLPTEWVVRKGECLWIISGHDEVYRDPMKWPRLYRANRAIIKDPDLIYPDQVLEIPR
jgi:hypothetical protein